MLVGQLVNLRALEVTDAERVYRWVNDRGVTRFTSARYPYSMADEETWLRGMAINSYGEGVRLAIDTKAGEHIGVLELRETRSEDRKAELALTIGEKGYWSQGYGTDAVVTLLRAIFGRAGLERVYLHTLEYNERAQKAFRKAGFEDLEPVRRDRKNFLKMEVSRERWHEEFGGPEEEPDHEPAAGGATTDDTQTPT